MSVQSDLREVLEEVLEGAAQRASEMVVEQATEGMTIEERLRRTEIQSQLALSKVDSVNRIASEAYHHLSEDLDSAIDNLLSVLFEVIGHVLNHPFSEEERKAVQERMNELFDANKEAGVSATSGSLLRQAITEHLSRRG
jgi:hypothetical protein